MLDAFHLGGWGMYPTLIAGIFLLRAAFRYSREGRSSLAAFVILALTTLGAGTLGFLTGLMNTLQFAAGQPNQGELIALGTFESLHNLALALILLVAAGVVASFGLWRAKPRESGEASHVASIPGSM